MGATKRVRKGGSREAGTRLRDYFAGRRLSLAARLSPAEVEGRINAAATSIWRPFATGTIGWARFGVLRLRYRRSVLFAYNAKPVLAGRISPSGSGSRIDLNYRAPMPMYVAFPLWYAALALIAVTVLSAPGARAPERLILGSILLVVSLVPIGFHYLGTASAEADFDELIAFLGRETGAQPVAA